MYSIPQLQSLVTSIDCGSLSEAARHLGLTQPAVSQHLQQLEQRMQHPLLIRSRHGVKATQAGLTVYHHATRMIAELADMDDALNALSGHISGHMKFTTNILFSQTIAIQFFDEMRNRAPNLKIELVATDAMLDVESQHIDLALRAGTAGDGGGVVRRIANLSGVLVARPDYLDRVGRPTHPSELGMLDYIQYRENPDQTHLQMHSVTGQGVKAPVRPAFAAHSPNLLLHAVENSIGFAQAPLFYVQNMIASGALEQVLSGYTCAPKPLFLVQASGSVNSARNRVAREVLLSVLARIDSVKLTQSAMNEINGVQT